MTLRRRGNCLCALIGGLGLACGDGAPRALFVELELDEATHTALVGLEIERPSEAPTLQSIVVDASQPQPLSVTLPDDVVQLYVTQVELPASPEDMGWRGGAPAPSTSDPTRLKDLDLFEGLFTRGRQQSLNRDALDGVEITPAWEVLGALSDARPRWIRLRRRERCSESVEGWSRVLSVAVDGLS